MEIPEGLESRRDIKDNYIINDLLETAFAATAEIISH